MFCTFMFGFFFCYLTTTYTVTQISHSFFPLLLLSQTECFSQFGMLYSLFLLGNWENCYPFSTKLEKNPHTPAARLINRPLAHSLDLFSFFKINKMKIYFLLFDYCCETVYIQFSGRSHEYHNRCWNTSEWNFRMRHIFISKRTIKNNRKIPFNNNKLK